MRLDRRSAHTQKMGRGGPPPGGGPGGVPGLNMQGAQFSAINALRTGNMAMDMIVAMFIPLLFKFLFSDSKQLLHRLYTWLFGGGTTSSKDCIRSIAFQSVGSSLMGREHKNQVLQKAITLYLTERQVPFESVFDNTDHGGFARILGPIKWIQPVRHCWEAFRGDAKKTNISCKKDNA